jgi:hypothetical protein
MSSKNYLYQLWEKKIGCYPDESPRIVGSYETKEEASKVLSERNIQLNAECQWNEPDFEFEIRKVNRYKIEENGY